jgi:phosphocarrier protein HPr
MKEILEEKKHTNFKATFTVKNDKGLHTRPSTELVKCASGFSAKVQLHYKEYSVNAKSLLGILMLAAEKGSKIQVEADGVDAEKAVHSILDLAKNKFNIHY